MKKIFTLSLLLLSLTTAGPMASASKDCSHGHDEYSTVLEASYHPKILTPEDADYVNGDAFYKGQLVIEPYLRNFTGSNRTKALKALEVLEYVLNSDEFRDAVINHSYNGERTFVDNKGLTNEEIYEAIMDGRETLSPDTVGVVNLDLSLYTPKWWQFAQRNVVGYTNPDTPRIYMNTKFFSKFKPNEVAGNMGHEWTHKLGFGHDFNNNPARPYSVPYAIGYLVRDLGAKYLASQTTLH